MSIISMILNFAGSLCVLLFGMKLLSDGIQKSAGQRLQNALSFMTKNRFFGLLTGCVLTMIIQSSGATTVMVVSFVNASLVTLEQSVAVIFGANIGTTITAWIVALFGFDFKISSIAIPIFAAGYLLTVFKRFKEEGIGHAIMGEKGANVKAELLYIDIVRKVEKMGDSCFAIARQLGGTI